MEDPTHDRTDARRDAAGADRAATGDATDGDPAGRTVSDLPDGTAGERRDGTDDEHGERTGRVPRERTTGDPTAADPTPRRRATAALAGRLRRYDRLLEVGIGRRPDVAGALAAAGRTVVATDVREVPVPDGVRFVRDDVVARAERPDPAPSIPVDAVYALNLPPELHRPARTVARAAGADFLFTTLGGEEPAVPVERESLAAGVTLYVARTRAGDRDG